MIGSTLQKVSRARSNKARLLALFLALSVIEGLYFPKELLLFGFTLSFYVLISYSHRRFHFMTETVSVFGITDILLWGMLFLSMLGILHPIRVQDGLLEALSWGIFWFAYRLGVQISSNETEKQHLVQYIQWLAIVVALIGWLPYVIRVAGRLSSVFGYPNATAAFLGAVLLLRPHSKLVQIILGVSLLGTGSRAGVGLFLVVFTGQQILLGIPSVYEWRQRFQKKGLKGLWPILLVLASTIFLLLYNRPVWDNFASIGFSSSSWQERLVYYKDGITLAWNAGGLPQAGGWMAFPTVQRFPYWTADPHSGFIHILLNQGILGVLSVGIWIIYSLAQAWKYWSKSRPELEETRSQVQAWGALLFLGLHSLVDADFSFAALGFLFWLLFGMIQKREERIRHSIFVHKLAANLSGKGMLVLSITLCLGSGNVLLNPTLLEREQSWNKQANQWREQDPVKSNVLWDRSLNWDQTQVGTRRDQASHLLRRGNLETGLKAVEEVIDWQPFDPETYEWAQAIVWDTAEVQRHTYPEKASMLYRWVESVPQKIEDRVALLTPTDRLLWRGYKDFQPSQHIQLLAEYARQR
ncbi:O-antigen ligase domain-containing protein [Desulfosporosinus fructosivorans]|uniref:O-antigen ligase domain-containing protein n=2 Tax=Desulfosporosinus fructosivorans TaxID=2018669 RepID=A0A4Z0R2B2_9FIRM|nr:O-antigen ligase domain-containing protein [Desulfosporosinus fructosivorans]